MSADLDNWLTWLLENRTFTGWEPAVFGSAATAEQVKTVAGYPVEIDETLPDNKIVIRNREAFVMNWSHKDEPVEALSDMASRIGWMA